MDRRAARRPSHPPGRRDRPAARRPAIEAMMDMRKIDIAKIAAARRG